MCKLPEADSVLGAQTLFGPGSDASVAAQAPVTHVTTDPVKE